MEKLWSLIKSLFCNGMSMSNESNKIKIRQQNIKVEGDFKQDIHNGVESKEKRNEH